MVLHSHLAPYDFPSQGVDFLSSGSSKGLPGRRSSYSRSLLSMRRVVGMVERFLVPLGLVPPWIGTIPAGEVG